MQGSKPASHVAIIRVSLIALCCAAVAALGINLQTVVMRVDEASHARDVASFERGISLLGETTAAELVGLTIWDEAFENVALAPSEAWMRRNFGSVVFSDPAERVLVIDPIGKIRFSSRVDAATDSDPALAALAPVVDRVATIYAASLRGAPGRHSLDLEHSHALFEGIYAHDVALVGGEPVLVAASAFAPDLDTDRIVAGRPTVLVKIRQLSSGTARDRIAEFSGLADLRIHAGALARSTEAGVAGLRNSAGELIGHASWQAVPPGQTVIHAMLPVLAASALLVLAVAFGASSLLTRLARGLARRAEDASHAASHDAATGLANRTAFQTGIEAARRALRPGEMLGVVLVDLDWFKQVNDTLGHAAGDAVLIETARRMTTLQAQTSVIARLGGDEFALVSRPLRDGSDFATICAQLRSAVMQPFSHGPHTIDVSCSIGGALLSGADEAPAAALHRADLALYRAKRDGRGCYRLHDAVLDRDTPTDAERAAISSRTAAQPRADVPRARAA